MYCVPGKAQTVLCANDCFDCTEEILLQPERVRFFLKSILAINIVGVFFSLSEYMKWHLDNKECDQIPGLDALPQDVRLKHAISVWYMAARLCNKRIPVTK